MLKLHEELPAILEEIDAMVADPEGIVVELCVNIYEEGTDKYMYRRCTKVQVENIPLIVEKLRELS